MPNLAFKQNLEIFPSFDLFLCPCKQRKMFFSLYNLSVEKELRLSKQELKTCKNTKIISYFKNKIIDLIPKDFTNKTKYFKLNSLQTNVINNFLKKEKLKLSYMNISNVANTANINLAFSFIKFLINNNFSYTLKSKKAFKNFIKNRIKSRNSKALIKSKKDGFSLYLEDKTPTKIYPFWKLLDSKKLDISKDIQKAIKCIKKGKFMQVYLVYPKNKNFTKHINIWAKELEEFDYKIKIIPYSLRSILK